MTCRRCESSSTMTSRDSPTAWHEVKLIAGFFNKKLYSYAIVRSNCSTVIFDLNVVEENCRAPAKSSRAIAEVWASITAVIAADSSPAHVFFGNVVVGSGRGVVGDAGAVVVEGTAADGAVCVSLEEHAPKRRLQVNRERRRRWGSEHMGLPTRTYNPLPIFANGAAIDLSAREERSWVSRFDAGDHCKR